MTEMEKEKLWQYFKVQNVYIIGFLKLEVSITHFADSSIAPRLFKVHYIICVDCNTEKFPNLQDDVIAVACLIVLDLVNNVCL